MFHNTRLSKRVALGFQGGPSWFTTEVPNAGGLNAFYANWASPHYKFVADYSVLNPADRNEIQDCFMVMRGRRDSFRFKNHLDYVATNQALGTGDNTATPRQLKKYYSFGSSSVGVDIILPIADTLVVTANGTPFAVTVDDETGLVAPAVGNWPNGQVLLASFEFDIRVRFGQDYYPFTLPIKQLAQVSIDLVEALTP